MNAHTVTAHRPALSARRFARLLAADIRFQYTYGFYFLYAAVCLFYICILYAFPAGWRNAAASIIIFSDPAALGLFFMGAIVLLEKSERIIPALAVSPVRPIEYVLSKTVSLAAISALAAAILAAAAGRNPLTTAAAAGLSSVLFSLAALVFAACAESLNAFMLVTVPVELLFMVPPVISLFSPPHWLWRWYPPNLCMALIDGSFADTAAQALIGAGILALAFFGLGAAALAAVRRLWQQAGGITL